MYMDEEIEVCRGRPGLKSRNEASPELYNPQVVVNNVEIIPLEALGVNEMDREGSAPNLDILEREVPRAISDSAENLWINDSELEIMGEVIELEGDWMVNGVNYG